MDIENAEVVIKKNDGGIYIMTKNNLAPDLKGATISQKEYDIMVDAMSRGKVPFVIIDKDDNVVTHNAEPSMIEKIAKMLGVDMNEIFNIDCYFDTKFSFTNRGLVKYDSYTDTWNVVPIIQANLILGESHVVKCKFVPKDGDIYYHLLVMTSNTVPDEVVSDIWRGNLYDCVYMKIGNVFFDKKQAKAHYNEVVSNVTSFKNEVIHNAKN